MQARWDPLTIIALSVGVIAVSSSGPLIAYAAAPALAIAFWRNALAVGVLAPVTLVTRRDELRGVGTKWSVLSGLALAVHFGTWVPSVKLTTVATATALACSQPLWSGLIAAVQGRRLSRLAWAGMALAMVGVAVTTGVDFSRGGTAPLGAMLALIAGLTAAIYTALGERVRRDVSTTTYTTVCYGVCAIALLAVCLVADVQMTGFSDETWLAILALTVGAQLLGHSMFNYSLNKVSATTVSVLILLEVPAAAMLGWAWLGQKVSAGSAIGIVILLAGVALVLLEGRSSPGARTDPRQLPASDL